jgi:hypothetical protein
MVGRQVGTSGVGQEGRGGFDSEWTCQVPFEHGLCLFSNTLSGAQCDLSQAGDWNGQRAEGWLLVCNAFAI